MKTSYKLETSKLTFAGESSIHAAIVIDAPSESGVILYGNVGMADDPNTEDNLKTLREMVRRANRGERAERARK